MYEAQSAWQCWDMTTADGTGRGFYWFEVKSVSRRYIKPRYGRWLYHREGEIGPIGYLFLYREKLRGECRQIIGPDVTPRALLYPRNLWNTVDCVETRYDARLAREIWIGLPHTVDRDNQSAMLSAFVKEYITPLGFIADVSILRPSDEKRADARNWRGYIMVTDRPVTADGFTRQKRKESSSISVLLRWREGWADVYNRHMEKLGKAERVDHRARRLVEGEAKKKRDAGA